MTKSHKLSKIFSSIRTHIHPESTEKHENKKDTDKNVERVLQLLTAEENDTISMNTVSKSELASFIKDIHRGYETLYGRYDELTENLKKKFHKKEDTNGSFSFSSDSSDSLDLETEISNSHRVEAKMNISVEDYKTLQQQLESTSRRNHELEKEVASMIARNTAFEGIEAKLSEVQATNGVLENKIQILEENMKILQADIGDSEQKLEASAKKEQELNQRIGVLHEENENLETQKMEALHNLQKSEIRIEECVSERALEVANLNQKYNDLINEKEALVLENSDLLGEIQDAKKALTDQQNQANLNLKLTSDELSSKIAQLLSENETLKLKKEATDKKGHELTSRLKYAEEENGVLKSEINDLKKNSDILNAENIKYINITNDLNKQLEDKEAGCKNLESQHREADRRAEEKQKKVDMLSLEIEEVKNTGSQAYEGLKLKLEAKEQEEIKLKQILAALEDENHALISENGELASKVALCIGEVTDLKDQKLQLELEKSELLAIVVNLESKIEAKEREGTTVRKLFDALDSERHDLISQNKELLIRVEHSERSLADFKGLRDQLEGERSEILARMENLQSALESTNFQLTVSKGILQANEENTAKLSNEKADLFNQLKEEKIKRKELQVVLEHLKEESTTLSKQNKFLEEEKHALMSKLQQAEADFKTQQNELEELTKNNSILHQRNKDMNDRNSDLVSELGEKINEISTLQKNIKEIQDGAHTQIQAMSARVVDLQAEKDFLGKQKSELEDEMKVFRDGCIEKLSLFRKLEDEVTEKIAKQETLLECLRSSLSNLHKECKQLKNCFAESCHKIEAAGVVNEEQMKQINNLVERGQELQENLNLCELEKTEISREVSSLRGQLEAQSCLFKQKLKITETEYREKEERHTNTIEELQCNLKESKNELKMLSGNLNLSRSEVSRTINVIERGNSYFCQELYKLLSLFELKHCRIDKQVSSLIVEAKTLKEKLNQEISEKQEMKEAMQDMEVKLKKSEGSVTSLEQKTQELSVQLSGKKKEMEKVVMRIAEYDLILKELKETVKEKEDEIAARKKEKLEVINQLCRMIDYQLEKYNQLNEFVATALRSNRRLVIA